MAQSVPYIFLSVEEEILLCSLKFSWTEKERIDLEHAIEKVKDWDYFTERAVDTYLGTTVYVRLVKQLKLDFPEHVQKVLEAMYFHVLVKNSQLIGAYDSLALAFNKLELSYMPLKGIHFLKNYFSNDIGIRQLSDIDILFQPDCAAKVHDCLIDLGYSVYLTMPIRISKLLKNPTPYNYSKNGVTLDVHYALNRLESFDISISEVWKSAIKFESSFDYHLCAEDQLIHLCTHAFLHMKIYDLKQISFLDIVTLLSREKVNWEMLNRKMCEYNCEVETTSILFLTNLYFQSEIPENIMGLLNEEQKENLRNRFLLLLRENKAELKATFYKMKDRYFQFFHLLSWKNRFLFVAFYVFPDKPYLKQLYGNQSKWFFLWIKHVRQLTTHAYSSSKFR